MLGHPHKQLVEREVAAGVDDGAGVAIHDQKLIGLHGHTVLLDKVGEHQTGVILVAVEFQGHGRCAVQ